MFFPSLSLSLSLSLFFFSLFAPAAFHDFEIVKKSAVHGKLELEFLLGRAPSPAADAERVM
jgi:hypothetical protein